MATHKEKENIKTKSRGPEKKNEEEVQKEKI